LDSHCKVLMAATALVVLKLVAVVVVVRQQLVQTE
jgi:hypothetical protein